MPWYAMIVFENRPWGHAGTTLTVKMHAESPNFVTIRRLDAQDLAWVQALVVEHFGSSMVVSRGRLHDTRHLPGLVACLDAHRAEESPFPRGVAPGDPVGFLLYSVEDGACEVVVLVATLRRRGVATALLHAMRLEVVQSGWHRLWLVTTNNNLEARACYEALGWHQVALHRGAVREARRLKPEIPLRDDQGRPIEDEIEYEWDIDRDGLPDRGPEPKPR